LRRLSLLALMVGCSGPELEPQPVWITSATWEWQAFNHRLSLWDVEATPDGANVALIGGASTTGEIAGDDTTCDPELRCDELPLPDWSHHDISARTIERGKFPVETVEVTFAANAEGGSGQVSIPWAGDATVVLSGWVIDTRGEIPGACYNPGNGWLPTEMSLGVTSEQVGSDLQITANGSFAAGKTFEEMRECIDAVNDLAEVQITVRATVLGLASTGTGRVLQQASWEWKDESGNNIPQDPPEPEGITAVSPAWTALKWQFHLEDVPRGAYVRAVGLSATQEAAGGWATNESLTQLSAFDMVFDGTWVDLGEESQEVRTQVESMETQAEPVLLPWGQELESSTL